MMKTGVCSCVCTVFIFLFPLLVTETKADSVDPSKCQVYGPGLIPNVVLPARYFFIETHDSKGKRIHESPNGKFEIKFDGDCKLWQEVLDVRDGSLIVRYKLYKSCQHMTINVSYNGKPVAKSPYKLHGPFHSETCNCPEDDFDSWMRDFGCPQRTDQQILDDLDMFPALNYSEFRAAAWERFDRPNSMSVCNYVVKNNEVHRKCLGAHVGFKMFWDNILLSMARKVKLPDLELIVNLGDWPLVRLEELKVPMLSWCGSDETIDIVVPTYELTEATLECMGRVTIDMLSVQGNTPMPWEQRKPVAFWRGRDSSRERLDLIKIAREHHDLINASLTNFFFFRDLEDIYGPKVKHVSFFDFFEYKYQLNLDGTVAAYRCPFLLAGGSTVFKQDSPYYEHFYGKLHPWTHYVPLAKNLSDVEDRLKWAQEHDDEAHKIAKQGQMFTQENLMPKDIFCYYAMLFREMRDRLVSKVKVQKGMEKVPQPESDCECLQRKEEPKDEL
ncbi:protein O-glucosyltransferase 2-like [Neocloeon triangulifer]|uniref:protein O-glucosyltransferase 2-like n=1 Tax=Neocloeon triangulifer TaxID=2078957 RepID=UPI00286FA37F|nr:protein O-glucosyltransferase 2-like [Neocloeon triangulifer]